VLFRSNLVIVARVPLNYGDIITADKVKVVQWPASSMPEGTYNDIRAFSGSPQRVALRPILPGEPVLASKLAGPDGRATISALISKDKRAVAMRINDVAGVGGFVLPGDSVDVLLTRQDQVAPGGQAEQITDLLIPNVRVIAVDQNSNESSKDPVVGRTVTIEVDPVQAQKVALAGQIGSLSLALRNLANKDDADYVATVGLDDLRSDAYPSGRPAAAPTNSRPLPRYRAVRRVVSRASDTVSVKVGKGLKITTVEVKP
jgi:pilus assembly protein CpaB